MAQDGQLTLRISVAQNSASITITLEGRIAGLWAEELGRTWTELAPTRSQRRIYLDLCDATYADAAGLRILREIHRQTGAELVTSSPWTKYLAEEVTCGDAANPQDQPEVQHEAKQKDQQKDHSHPHSTVQSKEEF